MRGEGRCEEKDYDVREDLDHDEGVSFAKVRDENQQATFDVDLTSRQEMCCTMTTFFGAMAFMLNSLVQERGTLFDTSPGWAGVSGFDMLDSVKPRVDFVTLQVVSVKLHVKMTEAQRDSMKEYATQVRPDMAMHVAYVASAVVHFPSYYRLCSQPPAFLYASSTSCIVGSCFEH